MPRRPVPRNGEPRTTAGPPPPGRTHRVVHDARNPKPHNTPTAGSVRQDRGRIRSTPWGPLWHPSTGPARCSFPQHDIVLVPDVAAFFPDANADSYIRSTPWKSAPRFMPFAQRLIRRHPPTLHLFHFLVIVVECFVPCFWRPQCLRPQRIKPRPER